MKYSFYTRLRSLFSAIEMSENGFALGHRDFWESHFWENFWGIVPQKSCGNDELPYILITFLISQI